jgi:hypothetical protein
MIVHHPIDMQIFNTDGPIPSRYHKERPFIPLSERTGAFWPVQVKSYALLRAMVSTRRLFIKGMLSGRQQVYNSIFSTTIALTIANNPSSSIDGFFASPATTRFKILLIFRMLKEDFKQGI